MCYPMFLGAFINLTKAKLIQKHIKANKACMHNLMSGKEH